MAGVTQQSPLFARAMGKLAAAVNSTKGTEPIIGNMGLPAGIENGVAQLRNAYLSVYKEGDNKGQPFFRADARCVSPVEYQGGMTQCGPIAVCDTPKASNPKRRTFNDNFAVFRSAVATLLGAGGAETFDALGDGLALDTPQGQVQYEARLNGLLKTITQAKPYFHFRTWKGKKATVGPYKDREPQVQHVWGETCEWNAQVDPGAGVTYTEPSTNGHTEPPPDNSPTEGADGLPVGDDAQPQGDPGQPAQEEGIDLAAFVEKAKAGDEDAGRRVLQLAGELGISEEDAAAASWDELETLIGNASASSEGGNEEPESPVAKTWKKGDMCKYTIIDPKTGKPVVDKFKKPKKPVVCDITECSIPSWSCSISDAVVLILR